MTHEYIITGLTCNNCLAKVKSELLKHPDILSADVQLPNKAVITMQKHISLEELQNTISKAGSYKISESGNQITHTMNDNEGSTSVFSPYKPLILIFLFITGVSVVTETHQNEFDWMRFMKHFMAGFFIVFSFFKFLDLKGFAESYSTYDLLAKRIYIYGYVYPFIELLIGFAYLTGFEPQITHVTTIAVMGFSSIGVIQSVLNKKQIRCACLGTVFNLPMTTITIIEDLLMVAMAAFMLII